MSVLHIYTLYRTYGDAIFAQNIERLFGIAIDFASMIKENPKFELACEPQCNIVCFRYKEVEDDSNRLNEEIRNLLLKEGRFYIVQTVLNGQLYLRVSLINPLTTSNELKELLQKIEHKAGPLI